MPTVHLIIKGKVQGVFYRASAKKAAKEKQVTGWVKNTNNGDVEIIASGSEDAINQFIQWCKQGPPGAIVTNVIVTKLEDKELEGFEIL